MMQWNHLLTKERFVSDEEFAELGYLDEVGNYCEKMNPFEEDYRRIISSQSFRALQDKTQVFPLDEGDFIRTRLTHSVEVSTVARQLAGKIFQEDGVAGARGAGGACSWDGIAKTRQKILKELEGCFDGDDWRGKAENSFSEQEVARIHIEQIKTAAACAGLLHDMGNPPFGHYGEQLIGKYFEHKFNTGEFDLLTPEMKADFIHFEGNAQVLRILGRIRAEKTYCDYVMQTPEKCFSFQNLNLSYAVMNLVVKYPLASNEAFSGDAEDVKQHKNGYYQAERKVIDRIAQATGTKGANGYTRHPVTYIMEAADDISYATADLADAVKKELLSIGQFILEFKKDFDKCIKKRCDQCLELITGLEIAPKVRKTFEKFRNARDQFCTEDPELDTELAKQLKKWEKAEELIRSLESKIDKVEESVAFLIFESWLDELRNYLMNEAAAMFLKNYEMIMEGDYKGDLFSVSGNSKINMEKNDKVNEDPNSIFPNTIAGEVLGLLKKPLGRHVFRSREMVDKEISASRVMEMVLDTYVRVLQNYSPEQNDGEYSIENSKENRKKDPVSERYLCYVPNDLLWNFTYHKCEIDRSDMSDEEKKKWILYYQLLTVTDFVSGMTDSYVTNLYKLIMGTK